jgi:hypothetical protein
MIPYFTTIYGIFCLLMILGVTALNIAVVGYERHTIATDYFNVTHKLWYERVFPSSGWFPPSRNCEGSIIKIGESMPGSCLE